MDPNDPRTLALKATGTKSVQELHIYLGTDAPVALQGNTAAYLPRLLTNGLLRSIEERPGINSALYHGRHLNFGATE